MVKKLNFPSLTFKKKKFYLNGPYELIRQKIKSVLSNYFDDDVKIESHLRYHFIKYIYVIDRILRANRYWNKSLTGFHYLDYKSLFQITNHRSYELKDKSKMTMARMVTRVLEEAGLLERSKRFSRKKNLSYEYKVLEIPGHQFELFDLEDLDLNQHDQIFLEKLEDYQKTKFHLDSDIAEKMTIWMQSLDFSRVKTFKLSRNHFEYLLLFEESKFQVLAGTGRIYNSFTNLPKTIRKDVLINGEYLGDLDIANAQAIFLCKIVIDRLIAKNKVLTETTSEFKTWAELGKAFEFLNGKENFKFSQTREAFKSAFWSLLMDKSSKSHTYAIYSKVFEKIPQIMEVVDEIKKKDHRVMSHLLQREESRVMMRCYEEIMNDVISSPIHDALFFPFSQRDLVIQKVLETLGAMGIKCTIKWQGNFNDGKWKSGIEMTFTPELEHSEVMYYHATMFKWYPAKYKSMDSKNNDKSSILPVYRIVS
ncbi:MAG: hypothetical protein P8O16_03505 [Algoriphagus sp.]|uniref:hypothetical protein n=1 Tax=Algoriphagus sp. TaxID=1872435 RepID=UPI00261DAE03|nr:hypothetical protein [Algoriphagus sp.]MDG1276320.1 hypothetical protein [Algoriphagus sp.]